MKRKPPNHARIILPVWQSALLAHGCQMESAGQFMPLELHPVGDQIVCTPTVSGCLLPFNVAVMPDEDVTISWDDELSRYIVLVAGQRRAA